MPISAKTSAAKFPQPCCRPRYANSAIPPLGLPALRIESGAEPLEDVPRRRSLLSNGHIKLAMFTQTVDAMELFSNSRRC